MRDEIRRTAWLMVSEAGAHQALADEARNRYGWRCTDRAALARVSQWLNPRDPHQFPLDLADALIELCVARGCDDRLTPLLHRAAMRAEDRREAEPERVVIHRAQPKPKADRKRA
jgi:hypothetical protein